MAESLALPAVDLLRSRFEYLTTGELRWKTRPLESFSSLGAAKCWNTRYAGAIAGTLDGRGYMQIAVDGRLYRGHRIIWAVVKGVHAAKVLDHKNGDKTDNRIENLREATNSENEANKGKNPSANKAMPKGVYQHKSGKFIAQIKVNGEVTYLGSFPTKEAAHECYADWHNMLFGEFSFTGVSRG